jgi:hypothetical protein
LANQLEKHKTREESPMTGPAASAALPIKTAPARFVRGRSENPHFCASATFCRDREVRKQLHGPNPDPSGQKRLVNE